MNLRLTFMLEIIQKMGEFQHKNFRTEIDFETKAGPMDTVSFVDRESEKMFIAVVNDKFPGDVIMGEETYDPLTPTNNMRNFGSSILLMGHLCINDESPFMAP